MTENFRVASGITVPFTLEALSDMVDLSAYIGQAWDRRVHPWRYPDRNYWPTFDLFPRTTTATRWVRERWGRIVFCAEVLRFGVPDTGWD